MQNYDKVAYILITLKNDTKMFNVPVHDSNVPLSSCLLLNHSSCPVDFINPCDEGWYLSSKLTVCDKSSNNNNNNNNLVV